MTSGWLGTNLPRSIRGPKDCRVPEEDVVLAHWGGTCTLRCRSGGASRMAWGWKEACETKKCGCQGRRSLNKGKSCALARKGEHLGGILLHLPEITHESQRGCALRRHLLQLAHQRIFFRSPQKIPLTPNARPTRGVRTVCSFDTGLPPLLGRSVWEGGVPAKGVRGHL